jgi:hypothetical protein
VKIAIAVIFGIAVAATIWYLSQRYGHQPTQYRTR